MTRFIQSYWKIFQVLCYIRKIETDSPKPAYIMTKNYHARTIETREAREKMEEKRIRNN